MTVFLLRVAGSLISVFVGWSRGHNDFSDLVGQPMNDFAGRRVFDFVGDAVHFQPISDFHAGFLAEVDDHRRTGNGGD